MDYNKLNSLKEFYKSGGNILKFLRENNGRNSNTAEDILISYDLQSGSYIEAAKKNYKYINDYTNALVKIINMLGGFGSILEAGVGEATTLVHVIKSLIKNSATDFEVFGFDVSFSRIIFAKKYISDFGLRNIFLSTGDLLKMPFADNSIDIVYTSHSIEPNGGKENEILRELFRVTKKYLILLEPAFDLASDKGKDRMKEHGYAVNLWEEIQNLNLKVIEHRLFDFYLNELNPTGLTIIEKEISNNSEFIVACPHSKQRLKKFNDSYFCEHSMLVYPIIKNIPCLLPSNAIVATYFNELI